MTNIQIFHDGPIVNKADAISLGLKRYFTGKPCRVNHVSERYTNGGLCVRCSTIDNYKSRGELSRYLEERPPIKQMPICEFYGFSRDHVILTRRDAKKAGSKHYFTGKPCSRGHFSKRFTTSGGCIECAEFHKAELKKKDPEYDHRLYMNNREAVLDRSKQYRIDNPDKKAEYQRNRRAKNKGSYGTHSRHDIATILKRQKGRCAEPTCGVSLSSGYHVDHIMPLSRGGSNMSENLQCLCPSCNMKKSNKHPLDWARENGRLL